MFDGLPLAQLVNIGPVGILTLVVLAIIFGLLIPKSTHTQRMADKDEQIKYLRATLDKREDQLSQALGHSEVAVKALEDIKQVATSEDVTVNKPRATRRKAAQ